MDLASATFLVVVIIFSAVIHEVMHGVAADYLGDKTARYAGRLTLNPLPHLDLFGSILLPLFFTLSNSPIFFGYAKPVPYNPYNLRPGRFSEAIVAFAGPFSNIVIALLAGLLIRSGALEFANSALFIIMVVNVMLCFFNLIPVPPLDGSKVLEPLLPRSMRHGYQGWRARMEMNPFLGILAVVLLIYVLGGAWRSFIYSLLSALAGL